MARLFLSVFLTSVLSTLAVETPEPFDCFTNFDSWQWAWTPGQQAWCCLNYNRGCVATQTSTTVTTTATSTTQTHSTSTETSSTSTVSSTQTQTETSTSVTTTRKTRTSTTATRTTTISPVEACKTVCKQDGKEATCGTRLMWVSQHVTNHEVLVCEAAAVMVVESCPEECGACTPEGAGCTTDPDWNLVLKKYDETALHNTGRDGRKPVLVAIGLTMVAVGVFGLFALIAVRARSRPAGGADNDALLVEDNPDANA